MTIKKLFGKLHLWLGLASGLVILVVCLTAAIWAFSPEFENLQSYRHVTAEAKPYLPITDLRKIAEHQLKDKKANRVIYTDKEGAVSFDFYGKGYYYSVFMNPYNGHVLKVKDNTKDFFRVVITGHYTLWLGEVGGQIVRWGTLIFLIMLISGIVLWWPRNKAARKQRFKVKLNASPKRLNYDLHNVLGFYASWIILFAALTGLVWTFTSVADATYWLASGGKTAPEFPSLISKKTTAPINLNGIDSVFHKRLSDYKDPASAIVVFPSTDSSVYSISVYPNKNYYEADNFFINQYTFEDMPVAAYGKYAVANGGEKLSRMNYDIHIGNIFGLTGRIAMFLAVLVGASLPITGFYIWWGRNKNNKKAKKSAGKKAVST